MYLYWCATAIYLLEVAVHVCHHDTLFFFIIFLSTKDCVLKAMLHVYMKLILHGYMTNQRNKNIS